jgi:hypothetical protein
MLKETPCRLAELLAVPTSELKESEGVVTIEGGGEAPLTRAPSGLLRFQY